MGLPVDLVAASPPTFGYLPCPEQIGLNILLLAEYVARETGLQVDLVAASPPTFEYRPCPEEIGLILYY